ncbi:MAG: energy-coupling factor ABC transporter ATP-binding protein, partial [Coriobacteriales bacterium]|nr:energy-coupling factor ABC transporter ATP-binding protein [Coriobacteriales bacterium]
SQLFAATVAEDVVFGPANLGRADTQEQREQIVRTSLEAVGLDPALFGPRSPFTLSGGEARRVALATILAMQPQMLLFDEPTAGLDRNGRIFFHQLVALQLASGTGVVVVSHDTDEFLPRVHSVLTLKEGRVIKADGSATVTISPCLQALPSGEGCICR